MDVYTPVKVYTYTVSYFWPFLKLSRADDFKFKGIDPSINRSLHQIQGHRPFSTRLYTSTTPPIFSSTLAISILGCIGWPITGWFTFRAAWFVQLCNTGHEPLWVKVVTTMILAKQCYSHKRTYSTIFVTITGFGNWIHPVCLLAIEIVPLAIELASCFGIENSSVTRLADGVNMKTRCSSCVMIMSKYNCCKQLFRRQ